MSTLEDYTDSLDVLVPGTHPVSVSTLASMQAKAVAKAIARHSRNRPQALVGDLAGDGGFDYPLSGEDGLSSWDDDFSTVRKVEYPVDDDDEDANVLDDDQWEIYETPSAKFLRFLDEVPAVGESIRVTYSARHTITAQACTVPGVDEDAVQALAASFYARMLAAAYVLNQDSTVSADSVDHKSQHAGFLKLSKEYRAEYDEHMGIQDGKVAPACQIQDQDVDYPGGWDRLTHPRRYR